ncbi:two-component system response regulator FixJ [Pseudoduganella flava]|nr:two-component system response regulator FixJ [Pseudoduganella flava]
METMARILLVDDEVNVLRALQRSLRPAFPPELAMIETFTDPQAALHRCEQVPFDVVVSDYRMPGMNGLELLAGAKALQPEAVRLMLSATSDFDVLLDALNNVRIFRYIQKPWNDDELRAVLREALASRAAPPPAPATDWLAELTPREREVLRLLVHGMTNRMIAAELGISARTVENHRAKVMEKTGADSLPELVRLAMKDGMQ